SPEEVWRLLEAAPGPKYKAALSVAYGAGLRVMEVVGLKVSDVEDLGRAKLFEAVLLELGSEGRSFRGVRAARPIRRRTAGVLRRTSEVGDREAGRGASAAADKAAARVMPPPSLRAW